MDQTSVTQVDASSAVHSQAHPPPAFSLACHAFGPEQEEWVHRPVYFIKEWRLGMTGKIIVANGGGGEVVPVELWRTIPGEESRWKKMKLRMCTYINIQAFGI